MATMKRNCNRLVLALVSLPMALPCTSLGQTIWYVDDDAALGGNGTDWEHAFKYLQDALLTAASAGDEIRVAQGSYYPDEDESGNVTAGDRSETFQLIAGVTLYGGYAGLANPSNPHERDIGLYETTLSGDLAGDDQPGFVNYSDNSLHVVSSHGTDATTVVNGLTISAGHADGVSEDANGGGMTTYTTNVTMLNCTFTGNAATNGGGGAYVRGSSNPTLINCAFIDNTTSGFGGGVYNRDQSHPTLSGCVFNGNAANKGGGIYTVHSNPVIQGCTFIGNWAESGAGLMAYSMGAISQPTLTACVFAANSADNGGGIHIANGSETELADCIITGNESRGGDGGGIRVNSATATLHNCIFSGNSAYYDGGAIRSAADWLTLNNGILVGNDAVHGGGIAGACFTARGCAVVDNHGGIYDAAGSDAIENAILWGNGASQVTGNPRVAYSCVEGGLGGTGNISDDPQFVGGTSGTWTANATYDSASGQTTLTDASGGWVEDELAGKFLNPNVTQPLYAFIVHNTSDTITVWADFSSQGTLASTYQIRDYHLTGASPCIDAGDPAFTPAPCETDMDDEYRLWNGDSQPWPIVDMGVDEYGSFVYGDLNCDGGVDNFDVGAFMLAVTSAPPGYIEYYSAYPYCNRILGDCNCDGSVDNFDIDGFVELLMGG